MCSNAYVELPFWLSHQDRESPRLWPPDTVDEVSRTVNFDIRKSGALQVLNQSSFRKNAHFQRCAKATVKYDMVKLLNNACHCFVS